MDIRFRFDVNQSFQFCKLTRQLQQIFVQRRLRGVADKPVDANVWNGTNEFSGRDVNVVQAIDVSDPAAPRELARLTSPEAFSGGADDAHDLVYRDGYLFVTAQTSHAMVVIRVRDQNIIRLAHGQTANQGLPEK